MRRNGSFKTRVLALILGMLLAFPCMSALADRDCWYFLTYGEHDYEQVDLKLPTCELDGYYLLECRQCGHNEKHITQKAYGHAWKMTISVGSTCDTQGYEKYVCDRCGKKSTKTFPVLNHDWVDGEVLEIATCTSEGCVRTYCSLCHINGNRVLPKASHTYGNWRVLVQATDHTQGQRTRNCSVCGSTDTELFYPDGTLYRGMRKNDDVVACQTTLIARGFLKDVADGVFGKKTEQAVKDFQNSAGLEATGVAYPQTLDALFGRIGETADPTPTLAPIEPVQPEPTIPADELPEFTSCRRYLDASGVESVGYCPHHASILEKYAELRNRTETDDATLLALDECRAEWQTELERLYDAWFAAASTADKPGIAQAKSMFMYDLWNREAAWTAETPEQPCVVQQRCIDARIAQCVDLCALVAQDAELLNFSFSHSGMSMDESYSYSVALTDQGYIADYDLSYGRILFSLRMNDEDAALLTDVIAGLGAWNGFQCTNADVSDGESFYLNIEYADGTVVSAYGSNAFPDGYSDAVSAIGGFFNKLMEKNDISINKEGAQ